MGIKIFKQRGVSLIELLMALSVVSAVLSSIFVLDNVRTAMEIRNVVNTIAMVQDTYRSRHDYSSLDNEEAAKLELIPANMIKSLPSDREVILRNGWGGDVFLSAGKAWRDDDSMKLIYNAVPTAACLNLLTSTIEMAEVVWVSGNLVKNTIKEPIVHYDITRSAAACRSGEFITMIWLAR